jgi:Rod binding domain-containing protein
MTGTSTLGPATALPADLYGFAGPPSAARGVEETGKQFEALFLSMMLKEMRQALEPEGLFAGDVGDVQGGLFDFYMGKHLADSGGVGLAASITRQLQPPAPAHDTPAKPAVGR